jgi:hypothetical protein
MQAYLMRRRPPMLENAPLPGIFLTKYLRKKFSSILQEMFYHLLYLNAM